MCMELVEGMAVLSIRIALATHVTGIYVIHILSLVGLQYCLIIFWPPQAFASLSCDSGQTC